MGVLRPPLCSAFGSAVPHGLERARVWEPTVLVELDAQLADAAHGDGDAVGFECFGLRAGPVSGYDARRRDDAVPGHGRGGVRDEVDGFFDTSGGGRHTEELGDVTTSYNLLCWDELNDAIDGKVKLFRVGPHVADLFITGKGAKVAWQEL